MVSQSRELFDVLQVVSIYNSQCWVSWFPNLGKCFDVPEVLKCLEFPIYGILVSQWKVIDIPED